MIEKDKNRQLAIVGGGPVGSVLAIGLAQQGWSVDVLEATADPKKRWGYDARTLAINLGSYFLLKRLGIAEMLDWQPIYKVRVSQRAHFGSTLLNAEEVDADALGYTVIARDLGVALDDVLSKTKGVRLSLGQSIEEIHPVSNEEGLLKEIKLSSAKDSASYQLIMACDGSNSIIRSRANIPTSKHNFQQRALLGKVIHEKPHNNTAHERFLDKTSPGVFAMLPLVNPHESSLVWVMPQERAQKQMCLSDSDFMSACNVVFSEHLGRFTSIRDRADYPMTECIANHYYNQRTLLLGNAAHALHPIAGQGLNIGFRDVSTLLECFKEDNIAEETLLNWAGKRHIDSTRMSRLTHLMIRSFSHPVLSRFASASLVGLEFVSPLKRAFSRHMMSV